MNDSLSKAHISFKFATPSLYHSHILNSQQLHMQENQSRRDDYKVRDAIESVYILY